ncbi:MAG: efflux RND transporter periplasmic adaptor subunit [Pseudomonadota bacterium]
MQRNFLKTFFVTLIGLSISAPLFAQQDEDTEFEPVPRPAKLIDVVEFDPTLSLVLPAEIEPSLKAVLTLQVGGLLVELPVAEGQPVSEGDLIAKVDSTELENTYNTAITELADAEDEYNRAEQLFESNTISRVSLDRAERELDIAQLALDTSRKQLEDATLLAPFDGVISEVNVEQFQTVSAATAVVNLQSLDNYEAFVSVPASSIANSAEVEIVETTLVLDVAPLLEIPAQFKYIAPQADPSTQTYEVRFEFEPPEGLIVLPGMSGEMRATATVPVAEDASIVDVPLSAIMFDGSETFVWRVEPDAMTVSRIPITVGEAVGEYLPVTAGLAVGDTIVAAGASYLAEGQEIRRWED